MTREEKINTLKAIIQECEEYQWQRREALFEIIKDLEQEPKTGRWIYDGIHHGLWHYCSECGEDAVVSNWKDYLTHYCPKCGAKMIDEQERSDK